MNTWSKDAMGTKEWSRLLERARSVIDDHDAPPLEAVRPLVRESWLRSRKSSVGLDATAKPVMSDDDVEEYRRSHILAPLVPIVHKLLLRHTLDEGLIVAIGDEAGRLLWVEGDRQSISRADAMGFRPGTDWSEESMGTSAPGVALALNQEVQIHSLEHFAESVVPWSCSAVPIHHPEDKRVIGVLDITGDQDAVLPVVLPLLQATAAAMEAELHARRLDELLSTHTHTVTTVPVTGLSPTIRFLGRDRATLEVSGQIVVTFSPKHSEILALLTAEPSGFTAEALADKLYGESASPVTIRAEITRLKKVLKDNARDIGIDIESMPYRLSPQPETDIKRVSGFIGRGAHRVALAKYPGPVLPGSTAPGVEDIRARLSGHLREVMLQDASVDVLLDYARTIEAIDDQEVWEACLRLLPPRSPKRSEVVLRLEDIASTRN
jgi:hypothetical protein